MRATGQMGLLSLAVASFLYVAASCRGADTEINEPVFGFSYFSSQASFQKIHTESLGAACLDMALKHFFIKGKFEPRLYLYGDYQNGDSRLRIVGDAEGTSIFVQRGRSCEVGPVVVSFIYRSKPPAPSHWPDMSQPEIDGVFADLLRRYVAAFGGKAKFFAWLDPLTNAVLKQCEGMSHAYCHPTWHDLPPDLQAMLEQFRYGGNE